MQLSPHFPPPATCSFITLFLLAPTPLCPGSAPSQPGLVFHGHVGHPLDDTVSVHPLAEPWGHSRPQCIPPQFSCGQGPRRHCTCAPNPLSLPPRGDTRVQTLQPPLSPPWGCRGHVQPLAEPCLEGCRQGQAGMLRQLPPLRVPFGQEHPGFFSSPAQKKKRAQAPYQSGCSKAARRR